MKEMEAVRAIQLAFHVQNEQAQAFIRALRPVEERMRDHAWEEARREVACWLRGESYCWRPFEE